MESEELKEGVTKSMEGIMRDLDDLTERVDGVATNRSGRQDLVL
jgi:hypothetical protein